MIDLVVLDEIQMLEGEENVVCLHARQLGNLVDCDLVALRSEQLFAR